MLFNSLEFAVFLPIVFAIYWLCKSSIKLQNVIILVSSYLFYGWWDWRFLGLIFLSTIIDYFVGLGIEKSISKKTKRVLLILSLSFNLGILGFFKYYNFFLESFVEAFSFLGTSFDADRLSIILPVGISFYTFQTLSYSIDVYRKNIPSSQDFLSFASFVSFFPQLVAGPIERASHLLPQFQKKRFFDYALAADGMRQILWGFFKKVVIADGCAVIVNDVFQNYGEHNASTLVIGAIAFSFQIYGDFSGYSDIAIGTSKLFGFDLMTNFKTPYFSRNIAEFWNRWHISLSTWFRDYLYIPLGGSKISKRRTLINVLVVFTVSGFWHGANWTFIIWGLLNGLLFIPLLLNSSHKKFHRALVDNRTFPGLAELGQMLLTFTLVTILWVVFRADNVSMAYDYLGSIFDISILEKPRWISEFALRAGFICLMLWIEWKNRSRTHEFEISYLPPIQRRVLYGVLFLSIFFFGKFEANSFIYFQF